MVARNITFSVCLFFYQSGRNLILVNTWNLFGLGFCSSTPLWEKMKAGEGSWESCAERASWSQCVQLPLPSLGNKTCDMASSQHVCWWLTRCEKAQMKHQTSRQWVWASISPLQGKTSWSQTSVTHPLLLSPAADQYETSHPYRSPSALAQ